jgi:hypothetical protein
MRTIKNRRSYFLAIERNRKAKEEERLIQEALAARSRQQARPSIQCVRAASRRNMEEFYRERERRQRDDERREQREREATARRKIEREQEEREIQLQRREGVRGSHGSLQGGD